MRNVGRVMLASLALVAAPCTARAAAPGTTTGSPLFGTLVTAASKVSFQAHDPLETIDGRLPITAGVVRFDPLEPPNSSATLSLDPSGITTGNALRDTNARRALLHVDSYPSIVYRLDQVTLDGDALPEGGRAAFSARGRLSLVGATHSVSVSGTVARDGHRLIVDATFPIRLTDIGLQPPRFLFITVADDVEVTIHLEFDLGSP